LYYLYSLVSFYRFSYLVAQDKADGLALEDVCVQTEGLVRDDEDLEHGLLLDARPALEPRLLLVAHKVVELGLDFLARATVDRA